MIRLRLFGCLLCLVALPVGAANPPAGACATAHPLATAACIDTLAAGGTAFDAAVAASATLTVVEPFGSGLGGGGFFLLHRARDRADFFVDGRETAPLAATADMYRDDSGKAIAKKSLTGMLAAAIPHQPALLAHTAQRYGTRPLAVLLVPALKAAREGFVIDGRLAGEIARNHPRMDAAMRAVYAPQGQPLKTGERLVQADLAATIERLGQNGAEEFRRGETAKRMLAGVTAQGGIWSAKDLDAIRVVERQPLVGRYRGYRVVTAPPPSAGGAAILEALAMIDARGYRHLDDLGSKHLVIEALRRAYRDRNAHFGDPDFVQVPLRKLLSTSYLRALAAGIGAQATPSSTLPAKDAGQEGGQTTHFSIIDAAGNRVAGTQSLNLFFGAAVMAPGTGVVLNDEMDDFSAATDASNAYGLLGSEANAIAPGKRPLSTMAPTFAEGPNGVLVIGTPGGSRIASMVLLGLLRFTEGANAAEIVASKRFHHQWLPDLVQFEPGGLSEEDQLALKARGHQLKPLAEPYGNLQAVIWNARTGALDAAADPRWVGSAATTLRQQ
ncbi:MAG: gamma-glutamyltransferase [Stagnimonas sp.]|nr:gamma-glutamyltransferase [Stagnimonas sp.]